MRRTLKLATMILFLGLFACQSNPYEKETQLLKKIVNSSKRQFDDYTLALIVPSGGCGGCISNAEQFMQENIQNKHILFCLTGFYSEKDIKFQYGNILSAENMYVDKGNVLYQNGLASIYPILYHLQNGEITLREEISPENPEVLDHITLEE